MTTPEIAKDELPYGKSLVAADPLTSAVDSARIRETGY